MFWVLLNMNNRMLGKYTDYFVQMKLDYPFLQKMFLIIPSRVMENKMIKENLYLIIQHIFQLLNNFRHQGQT